jgi:hypothetical protein
VSVRRSPTRWLCEINTPRVSNECSQISIRTESFTFISISREIRHTDSKTYNAQVTPFPSEGHWLESRHIDSYHVAPWLMAQRRKRDDERRKHEDSPTNRNPSRERIRDGQRGCKRLRLEYTHVGRRYRVYESMVASINFGPITGCLIPRKQGRFPRNYLRTVRDE